MAKLSRIRRAIDPAVIGLTINLQIEQFDELGRLIAYDEQHNLVVTAGRNLARDLLRGTVTTPLSHMAIGTSSTAVSASDTALVAEVHRASFSNTSVSSGVLTLKYALATTAGNGNTLREAGLLTASSGGTLFARATYSPIAKTSAIQVIYTWTVTISAS